MIQEQEIFTCFRQELEDSTRLHSFSCAESYLTTDIHVKIKKRQKVTPILSMCGSLTVVAFLQLSLSLAGCSLLSEETLMRQQGLCAFINFP